MEIITICGSLKFKQEMNEVAEKLSLAGNCVLSPIFLKTENLDITKEQVENLKRAHFKRIELSDAIYVINKNNYIGESTKLEIEHASKLGKKIMYLEKT